MNGESVDVVNHKVRRTQYNRHHRHFATDSESIATESETSSLQGIWSSISSRSSVQALNPLSKYGLQLNCFV